MSLESLTLQLCLIGRKTDILQFKSTLRISDAAINSSVLPIIIDINPNHKFCFSYHILIIKIMVILNLSET